MALNFHQLHIFHTVADKGSFSTAAQALHMTQPAVTMQIQTLEEQLGVKLFVRTTKKIELTEAGRELIPYAKRSIDLIRETEEAMAEYCRKLTGRLHLGASLTVGEYMIPRLLGPFNEEYPQVTVSLKVINTTQIIEEITQHTLNFGLVEAPVEHPDMQSEAVLSDELKLIVPSCHPLAGEAKITADQALAYPFVLREKGSGTRRVMEEELQRCGIDPRDMRIVLELGSTGAVKSAVEANLGLSILSQSAVKHEVALGILQARTIEGIRFNRNFYAVHLKTALLPMSAVTFLTFLRERDLSKWL